MSIPPSAGTPEPAGAASGAIADPHENVSVDTNKMTPTPGTPTVGDQAVLTLFAPCDLTTVQMGASSQGPEAGTVAISGFRVSTAIHAHVTAQDPLTTISLGSVGGQGMAGETPGLGVYTAGDWTGFVEGMWKITCEKKEWHEIHDDKNETLHANSNETTIGNMTEVTIGDKYEFVQGTTHGTHIGDAFETQFGSSTELTFGNKTETIIGNTVENQTGNKTETMLGDSTATVQGSTNETYTGTKVEMNKGGFHETTLGLTSELKVGAIIDTQVGGIAETTVAGKLEIGHAFTKTLDPIEAREAALEKKKVALEKEEVAAKKSEIEALISEGKIHLATWELVNMK